MKKIKQPIARRARQRRKPGGYQPAWRPTWDDYAEVVMGLSEAEVITFLARTVRRNDPSSLIPTHRTLRALARAGLMGQAPGWRSALRDSFSWIDRNEAVVALTSVQAALSAGRTPLDPKYGLYLRRMLSTCSRLGLKVRGSSQSRNPIERGMPQASRPGKAFD